VAAAGGSARALGGHLDDPATGVHDAQAGFSAWLLARITGDLDGFAGFDWAASVTSVGLATDRYARHVFLAGVVGHITGKFTQALSSADDLSPLFQAGRVRLRVRIEQAGEVRVIGSWTVGQRPHPCAPRAAWLVGGVAGSAPGTYRHRFLVDGRAIPPSDGAPTLPDDFGDRMP